MKPFWIKTILNWIEIEIGHSSRDTVCLYYLTQHLGAYSMSYNYSLIETHCVRLLTCCLCVCSPGQVGIPVHVPAGDARGSGAGQHSVWHRISDAVRGAGHPDQAQDPTWSSLQCLAAWRGPAGVTRIRVDIWGLCPWVHPAGRKCKHPI